MKLQIGNKVQFFDYSYSIPSDGRRGFFWRGHPLYDDVFEVVGFTRRRGDTSLLRALGIKKDIRLTVIVRSVTDPSFTVTTFRKALRRF